MYDEGFRGWWGGDELDGMCSDALRVTELVEEGEETERECECVVY